MVFDFFLNKEPVRNRIVLLCPPDVNTHTAYNEDQLIKFMLNVGSHNNSLKPYSCLELTGNIPRFRLYIHTIVSFRFDPYRAIRL